MVYFQDKFVDNGSTIISDSIFANIFSDENGGGIQINISERNLEVYSSSFCNCSSGLIGGAIYSACNKNNLSNILFSWCKSGDGAAIYLDKITDLEPQSSLLNLLILCCESKNFKSKVGETYGHGNISLNNISHCQSQHIVFLIRGTSIIQTLDKCMFLNNTASSPAPIIQYNTVGSCKILNTNFVGKKEIQNTACAIRLTSDIKLHVENCYFMQELSSIFMNDKGQPTVTITNCYRLNDIPINLSGHTIELNPNIQTVDVRFEIKAVCPVNYPSQPVRTSLKFVTSLSFITSAIKIK